MVQLFLPLLNGFHQTGHLHQDVPAFLIYHECPKTAVHCGDVAQEARRIALIAGADPAKAEIAGWLHDVSAVFPSEQRIEIARQLDIEVLPEETQYPMIIHQKLSVVLAEDVFQVHHPAILSAIDCHTTLKAGAGLLDKVLFVADKLAWDQPGEPPYQAEILAALEQSLDAAVKVYLQYLWDRRESLKVIHPWFKAAYEEYI